MEAGIRRSHGESPATHQDLEGTSKPLTGKVEEAGLLLAQVVEELGAEGKRRNGETALNERERRLQLVVTLRHALKLLKQE